MKTTKGTERTVIVVARSSMLRICTAGECTTIVFGHGTCIEHDERDSTGTARAQAPPATPAEQARERAETLAPAT